MTSANRFDRENEARKTLAQIVGGVFLLAGLYSSTRTLELSRQNEDLVREGQITDRFTKAIEQLGAVDAAGKPKLEVRLGGIYELERIARDSDRDHPVVMEVLTAYVREHAPVKTFSGADAPRSAGIKDNPIGADIQAILTVIGRRETRYDRGAIDLSRTSLVGADLRSEDLHSANLFAADLSSAHLDGANLIHANLGGANLDGAFLTGVHLNDADLDNADLNYAHLDGANLSRALLGGANLIDADLIRANLFGADFGDADLSNADLGEVDLSSAYLREVIELTQHQINSAHGDSRTQLPEGLKMPSSWSK